MPNSLFVFAGQSNAFRWGNSDAFAEAISSAQMDIGFVNAAVGGASTRANPTGPDWYPYDDARDDTGELFPRMFDLVDGFTAANADAVVDTVIWAQGEAEANKGNELGGYLERLIEIYDRFRSEYGEDFRFVFLPLADFPPALSGTKIDNWSAVQTAHDAFLALHPDIQVLDVAATAAAAGVSIDDVYGDALHYSSATHEALSAEVLQDWTPGPAFETAMNGGDLADTLTGRGKDDFIFGNGGADVISGRGGQDTISGGLGDDRLYGKGGDDVLLGEGGDDLLIGGAGNDALFGGLGADTLKGNKGDDSIYAGAGDTEIYGGGGSDSLYGGAGADTILGGGGADRLDADAGDDILSGGGGNDTLISGFGDTFLTGGSGADVFQFRPVKTDGAAYISDFQTGVDRIEIFTRDEPVPVTLTSLPQSDTIRVDVYNVVIFIENGAGISVDDITIF